MIIAYADPPYIKQAAVHYGAPEVDHRYLLRSLAADYPDGWALSSGATLEEVATLAPIVREVDPLARLATWVKPFASFKPGVNPGYAFELVWYRTTRKRGREEPTVRDWIAANITLQKGTSGAKPPEFCFWLFALLGLRPDDTFVDVFTGSGGVSVAWESWRRQTALVGTRAEAALP